MTDKSDNDAVAAAVEADLEKKERKPSLLERIGGFFSPAPDAELVVPSSTPVELSASVRLAWHDQPFALTLGRVTLEVFPDLAVDGKDHDGIREWIVRNSRAGRKAVPSFIRIRPGKTVLLGRGEDAQSKILGLDKSVADRHARITNQKGELTIEPLSYDKPIQISAMDPLASLWRARRENLMRLPDVLNRPLAEFDDEEALDMIRDVNRIMAVEAYRELDDEGNPGAIIRFPDEMLVVIMGDVHARCDNILRVLTEGSLLSAMEQGEACLVFLGDLLHSEAAGELEDMDSSVLVLDLFCTLKRHFPKNVFYIHGNHESFSPNIAKGGVPQGLLFRKHLKKRRGKAYVAEVETLFSRLAFIVHGQGFAACHGAPVRSKVDQNTLVNIRRYPGLQYELVWNRLRQGNRPAGYGKGSVKRFRQTLNLPKHAPLIVGHTPLSPTETLWLNVGDIEGHHIVYSAHTHRLAAMVIADGQATPEEFIPDASLAFLSDRRKT